MKLALQLGILSSINIGVGFLYQWYVFTQLGPGMETDALFAGMSIPQLTLAVVTGSLIHVLVPLLAGENEEQLRRDTWGIMALVSGLFTILAGVLFLTAHLWVPFTVPGFKTAGKALTVSLTRIQLLGMVFSAISSVQWAAYHAKQHFLWAEFTPIIASISGFFILIWALPRYGVTAAAWIATLRMGLQVLFLAPGMGKPIWPEMNSPALTEAWRRIKPLLLGTAYYKTEPVVDRFLLSWANSGSLSLFYLAQRLYSAINQICNKAIVAPLVPLLGKFHKTGNGFEFRRAYKKKLDFMILIGSAGILVLGICGQDVLSFLIGHGNVTTENINELWWILIWLGGSFVGGLSGQITSSAFYASGDTVTPTKLSMVTYTVYLPAKVAAFFLWGVKGLAISTSVYYMVNLSVQIYFLNRKQFS